MNFNNLDRRRFYVKSTLNSFLSLTTSWDDTLLPLQHRLGKNPNSGEISHQVHLVLQVILIKLLKIQFKCILFFLKGVHVVENLNGTYSNRPCGPFFILPGLLMPGFLTFRDFTSTLPQFLIKTLRNMYRKYKAITKIEIPLKLLDLVWFSIFLLLIESFWI